jgi:hypothetical protein
MSADRKDEQTLIGKLLPRFRLGVSRLQELGDPARGISDFANKFGHLK